MSGRPSSRRRFLQAIGAGSAGVLLAACGAAPQAAEPAGASETAGSTQPGSQAATSDAPASASAASVAAASGPREIVDDEGVRTTLTAPPQRVATLYDSLDLDACLALAVEPIAYCTNPGDGRAKLPWKKIPATTNQVAVGEAPNLEQLTALQPDFVLSAWGDEKVNAQLREFCPVVYLPFDDWRAATRMAGHALFRDEAAGALVTQTEARIAGVRERVSGVGRVNVLGMYGEDIYLDQGGSNLGQMLNELGVPLDGSEFNVQVSLEALPEQLTADTLIVLDYSYNFAQSQRASLDALLADPILARVPAIANRRVLHLTSDETAAGYLISALSIPTLLGGLERLATL